LTAPLPAQEAQCRAWPAVLPGRVARGRRYQSPQCLPGGQVAATCDGGVSIVRTSTRCRKRRRPGD